MDDSGDWAAPKVEPTSRWIRVRFGGEWIADSRRALLVIQYAGKGRLPTYFVPLADVHSGALVDPRDHPDGTTSWDLRAGDHRADQAAWAWEQPAELADHVTFSWDAVDWHEEDEQVYVHARDPHKRVDVVRSSRHVRVEIDGHTLAETTRPSLLFETWLPDRYYIPADDVRMELLEPSAATSRCPYKGVARYWSARIGDQLVPDVVWSYPEPILENPKIRDLLCFFNERVDLTVDGRPQERPRTYWS